MVKSQLWQAPWQYDRCSQYQRYRCHCSSRHDNKNAHHRPSRDRMAASRLRTRDAMNFLLVVAWCNLASHVAINLRRHRFWRYGVPRYARCCYLTVNSAYCCHPLMDSMKSLIVASSSRLAMVEPLSLHPGSTTAFRNIKKCYVIASSR
jgi:hypothetical protein